MKEKQHLRVLVVDDEQSIRRFLKTALISYGYAVFEAATGKEALEKSVSAHPDLAILDIGLPDIDGIEVVREIRKRTKMPIIILSVREDMTDKITALDAGADDYLTKPFNTSELLARMRAVMRRLLPSGKDEILRVGRISMDITNHSVLIDENEISLTPTEYDILKSLMLNTGRIMTHRRILKEIWDKNEDFEGALHLLRVTVSNLRDKIERDPDRPAYVITEPGIGYRLRSED